MRTTHTLLAATTIALAIGGCAAQPPQMPTYPTDPTKVGEWVGDMQRYTTELGKYCQTNPNYEQCWMTTSGALTNTAPTTPTTPAPEVKAWGETGGVYGVDVRVANPRWFVGPTFPDEPGKRYVAVEVTFTNNSGVEQNTLGFTDTNTDVGYAMETAAPDYSSHPSTFLPGDTSTKTQYFKVDSSAKELRLEVATGGITDPSGQQNYTEAPSLHFRGPIS